MRSEPGVPDIDESRFELLEEIGVGGMGSVYRAVQRSVGRYVAVKMLLPEHASNASGLARFVREANVIARLTHPNIVQLIDFGRDRQGNLLLVMELLEGEPLRTLLRREGRLPADRAALIAAQCLQALRTAHAAGVIHRDLKPENVFVHRTDDGDHVKVLDFGVAKITEADVGDVNANHTAQGSMVGTLRYMAPEQVAGEAPDQRIDVYAMGVVLYEMLSGALPYDGRDRFVLLRQIIAEAPIPLLARAPDVPAALADVVMRAIAKHPSERFANVEEFRRALLPMLGQDMARWMVSGESSGRFGGSGSGVVPAGAVTTTGRLPNPSSSTPIANSEELRLAMREATHSSPGAAPPQPSRKGLWVAVLLAATVALGLSVAVLMRPPEATPAAPGTTTTIAVPVVSAAPPPAAVAHRMVVVQTTPPGAQVVEGAGTELCPATPCAVSVPVGGTRAVTIVSGALRLPTVLDGNAANASIELPAAPGSVAVVAPTPPVARPPNGGGVRHPRRRADEEPGGEIPMLLPH